MQRRLHSEVPEDFGTDENIYLFIFISLLYYIAYILKTLMVAFFFILLPNAGTSWEP